MERGYVRGFDAVAKAGVVGALAAWGVAEGDWASVWQAVIVDLFSGGAAWGDTSCAEAAFPAGIDAFGARGDFARHCGGPIDALDSQVARARGRHSTA